MQKFQSEFSRLTSNVADTDFVEARINAAFTLIDHAYTELNKAAINPDVDDWHNMMFGRNYAATASELRRNMKNRFNGLLLIRDKTDHDTTIPGVRTDVRFYCTLQRITKNKIGEYVNKDTGYTFKKGEMSNRFANCYDGLSAAMMSTFTLTGNMSQVQICPWYLRTVIEGKHRDLASLPAMIFSGVSKIYMPVKMKLSWTPIDAFRMMDNTIIHELTHTDQVEQATADQKKSFREGAYGKPATRHFEHSFTSCQDSTMRRRRRIDIEMVTKSWTLCKMQIIILSSQSGFGLLRKVGGELVKTDLSMLRKYQLPSDWYVRRRRHSRAGRGVESFSQLYQFRLSLPYSYGSSALLSPISRRTYCAKWSAVLEEAQTLLSKEIIK